MKKLIAALCVVTFLGVNIHASDVSGTVSQIIVVSPNDLSPTAYPGYLLVVLTGNYRFFVAPNDINYETRLSMALAAKASSKSLLVGQMATAISWGSNGGPSNVYYAINYMNIF